MPCSSGPKALVLALFLVACTSGGSAPTTGTAAEPPSTVISTTTVVPPRVDVGVEGQVIRLGLLLPLSGPGATAGAAESVQAGQRVWWDHVNQDLGGVGGAYQVELVVRDNAYDTELNQSAFAEIADGVLGIAGTVGTPITGSIQAQAAERQMLVGAGSLGSFWAGTDNVVLPLGANTYFSELANGPYWAMEMADPPLITPETQVGILYQDDDYGRDCLRGYEVAVQNLGFQDALRQAYSSADEDLGSELTSFQTAGVQVLFVCALPSVLGLIVGSNAVLGYDPWIMGSSPTYDPVLPFTLGGESGEQGGLQAFARYHNLGTVPAFEEDLPGMQLLRDNLGKYGADVPETQVTSFFYFGYTQAQTFHLILEEAFRERDLTRSGVLAAVDRVASVDLGFGMGPAGFGSGRIPTHAGAIGRPVSTGSARFGMERVSEFFVAPYLDDEGA